MILELLDEDGNTVWSHEITPLDSNFFLWCDDCQHRNYTPVCSCCGKDLVEEVNRLTVELMTQPDDAC